MISQMVDVVNKAPSFHWWEALKLTVESHPFMMGFILVSLLFIFIFSLYPLCQYVMRGNIRRTILFSLFPVCAVCFFIFIVNESSPSPVFSKKPHIFEPYSYVVKSDTKSMNKIKNSQTTLYYDKQHHVLNEFPDELTTKDKNEATVNDKKIKSLVLSGSKEQALDTLIDSPILEKMNKILAVSTTGNKTTIKYIKK